MSVNGSSPDGHCQLIVTANNVTICSNPTTSVLTDEEIDQLTGLENGTWAHDLLTLNGTANIIFNLTGTPSLPEYVGVDGVEVVMFNCPQWEIFVNNIQASAPSSTSATVSPGNTSCDSLVTVDIPYCTTEAVISLTFNTSNWVHLDEVKFYYNSSTCPLDIATTTTLPSDATETTAVVTTHSSSDTDQQQTATTSDLEMTKAATGTDPPNPADTNVIIPVVVVICVVFMIMGIMAAVLIQWRYHKHKTSHHTALGEGHSHAHTHSHTPAVKMCEETGQVCYSSPPEALGQLIPSHDTYSHLQRDTSEGRGGAQSEGEYSVVHMKECKGKGEYSVLFHANKPHVLERDKMEAMKTGDSTTHVYAQIDGVKKGKKETGSTGVTTHPAAYSSLNTSRSWEMAKPDTHLYDQVDKGKKGEVATHPHTPEADTAVDHFYAVLEDNREKKKGEVSSHPHTPEADTAVDHFYAVLEDNREKKEGEVATHPHTPEADTAVDHFYAVLEDNREKKEGEVATHPHTPEADTAVDHSYAILEDNREKKKGEVATHPHTPEDDTAVDQLYTLVKKENEVCSPLHESGPVYSALNKPSPPQIPVKSDLLMEDLQTP